MITRKTTYKFFRRTIRTNLLVLIEKLAYYNQRLLVANNTLDITYEIIDRNKVEFELLYGIKPKNINTESNKINNTNKIVLVNNSHNVIRDAANKLKSIDKSYGTHTVLFIKGIVDHYYDINREIKSITRQIQLINDKLEFFIKYENLSEEVCDYIILRCNKYYEKVVLNGGTVNLGEGLGIIKVDLKNISSRINWGESNKYRAELIANNQLPFNKEDSKLAKQAGIPYNGVKWFIMYENEKQPYINWSIYNKIPNKDLFSFKPTRFNLTKLNMSDLNKIVKTDEDIMNLDIGIVNKLSLLMNKNELQFLKYSGNDL